MSETPLTEEERKQLEALAEKAIRSGAVDRLLEAAEPKVLDSVVTKVHERIRSDGFVEQTLKRVEFDIVVASAKRLKSIVAAVFAGVAALLALGGILTINQIKQGIVDSAASRLSNDVEVRKQLETEMYKKLEEYESDLKRSSAGAREELDEILSMLRALKKQVSRASESSNTANEQVGDRKP